MKCKWCGAEVISIHAPLTGSDGGGNTWLEKRTRFQSTLPSQGATPYMEAGLVMQMISIHAPLTGSDPPVCAIWERLLISIHAPLTGSDSGGHNGHYGRVDFNPRSPHRERQICASVFTPEVVISIHAPLTGSDSLCPHSAQVRMISIHAPLTGSDISSILFYDFISISIHAPLTGSDSKYTHKIPL